MSHLPSHTEATRAQLARLIAYLERQQAQYEMLGLDLRDYIASQKERLRLLEKKPNEPFNIG